MDMMIRIDGKYHKQLRLSAFEKHTSLQSQLDEILEKHFRSSRT